MKPTFFAASVLAAIWTAAGAAVAGAAPERIETIPTRPGVTISFVVVEPAATPAAGVILFAGGSGKVRLWRRKPPWLGNNFLVLSRRLFAANGLYTLVVDVASDRERSTSNALACSLTCCSSSWMRASRLSVLRLSFIMSSFLLMRGTIRTLH